MNGVVLREELLIGAGGDFRDAGMGALTEALEIHQSF